MSEGFLSPEKTDTDNILADPLDKIELVKGCENKEKFQRTLDDFSQNSISILENSSKSWEEKGECIMDNLRYIKSGALSFQEYDFKGIVHSSLSDEIFVSGKPRNIKLCCQLIVAVVREKRKEFLPITELAIHSLFLCSANHSSSSFITQLCKQSLLNIVENVENQRTLDSILKESKSKMKENRLTVIECINTAVSDWPNEIIMNSIGSIKEQLQIYTTDHAEEIRSYSRTVLSLINDSIYAKPQSPITKIPKVSPKSHHSPPNSLSSLQVMPRQPQRAKSPIKRPRSFIGSSPSSPQVPQSPPSGHSSLQTQSQTPPAQFSSNSQAKSRFSLHPVPKVPYLTPRAKRRRSAVLLQEEKDEVGMKNQHISEFMPPENKETANSFLQKLKIIVDTGDYLTLESLEFGIPSSIIAAREYYPNVELSSMIVELTESGETMKEEMKNNIGDLVLSFLPPKLKETTKSAKIFPALTKDSELVIQYFASKFGVEFVIQQVIHSIENPTPKLFMQHEKNSSPSKQNKHQCDRCVLLFFLLLLKKKMISSLKKENILQFIQQNIEMEKTNPSISADDLQILEKACIDLSPIKTISSSQSFTAPSTPPNSSSKIKSKSTSSTDKKSLLATGPVKMVSKLPVPAARAKSPNKFNRGLQNKSQKDSHVRAKTPRFATPPRPIHSETSPEKQKIQKTEKQKPPKPIKLKFFNFKSFDEFISSENFSEYDISTNESVLDISVISTFISQNLEKIVQILNSENELVQNNLLTFLLDVSKIYKNVNIFDPLAQNTSKTEENENSDDPELNSSILTLDFEDENETRFLFMNSLLSLCHKKYSLLIQAKSQQVLKILLKNPNLLITFLTKENDIDSETLFLLFQINYEENCYVSFFNQQITDKDKQMLLYSLILERIVKFLESDETKYRRIAFSTISIITEQLENIENDKIDAKLLKILQEKIISLPRVAQNILGRSNEY